jgi:hypothetical protein
MVLIVLLQIINTRSSIQILLIGLGTIIKLSDGKQWIDYTHNAKIHCHAHEYEEKMNSGLIKAVQA